jgi:hypothetical protein
MRARLSNDHGWRQNRHDHHKGRARILTSGRVSPQLNAHSPRLCRHPGAGSAWGQSASLLHHRTLRHGWTLGQEKLAPILPLLRTGDWHRRSPRSEDPRHGRTLRHHSRDNKVIRDFGLRSCICILVNSPRQRLHRRYRLARRSPSEAEPWAEPHNDNVTYTHLLNIRRIAPKPAAGSALGNDCSLIEKIKWRDELRVTFVGSGLTGEPSC